MMALTIARAVVYAAEIALALPLLYLFTLTIGAAYGTAKARAQQRRGNRAASPDAATRFVIVVPAHDEELLIMRTLTSLYQISYPREMFDVVVIADNCKDSTAAIARAAGAEVLERHDLTQIGKGYALAWAFQRLQERTPAYDAYVVLDADSTVTPNLLEAFATAIDNGAEAIQVDYAVLDPTSSTTTALRWLGFSLMNYIRPLGRMTFGGSSTLTGNGMCYTRAMLQRHPWEAFGLSEDYQYYLTLVSSGEKAVFVPTAQVQGAMPTTFRDLQTQDIRWETVTRDSVAWQRRLSRQLLRDGIQKRRWLYLDAWLEMVAPPLSVLVGVAILVLAAAILLRHPVQIAIAAALVALLVEYIASAFVLLRPSFAVYRALVVAPIYLVRKLWTYFVLRRLSKYTSTWQRAARTPTA